MPKFLITSAALRSFPRLFMPGLLISLIFLTYRDTVLDATIESGSKEYAAGRIDR